MRENASHSCDIYCHVYFVTGSLTAESDSSIPLMPDFVITHDSELVPYSSSTLKLFP
jgi:hypothetical protein